MRPVTVSVGPLAAASANNIALSQTPGAAGNLVLNGSTVANGVATLDAVRQILLTTTADETGLTFTFTGTTFNGQAAVETIAGVNNGTASPKTNFKTLSQIAVSGAAAGALTVGTSGVATSPWVRFDDWGFDTIFIQADVTGVASYTIQSTLDDPNSPTNPVAIAAVDWFDSNDADVVNASASSQSNFGFVPAFARVVLNSGTGSVSTTFAQNAGIV